jgi:hypothetical protein
VLKEAPPRPEGCAACGMMGVRRCYRCLRCAACTPPGQWFRCRYREPRCGPYCPDPACKPQHFHPVDVDPSAQNDDVPY